MKVVAEHSGSQRVVSVCAFSHKMGSSWLVWMLLLLSVAVFQGCPPPTGTTCSSNADCKDGKVCKETTCVTPGKEGGDKEKTDTDGGDKEPPPRPDVTLKEGSFPTPDGFRDGKATAAKGQRKAGETCNPSLAAAAQDRCEEGALCASPFLSGFGICRKTCSLKNPSCPKGESCAPVPLLENGAEKGYVCAPTVPLFARCTVGQHCVDGGRCIKYGSDNGGICQKVCNRSSDCPKGQWCGGGREIGSNQAFQVCAYLRANVGETCGEHRMCGENLNCRGSGEERRCLKSCKGSGNCPVGFDCIKTGVGSTEIANCFPQVKDYNPCSSTTVCAKGSRCYTFSTSLQHRVCLKECTGNEKLCGQGETCVTSGERQYCMKADIAEGQACDGPQACAKGLTCTALAGGPRVCLKDCSKDASTCSSTQTCEKVGSSDSSKRCLDNCSSSNQCKWLSHACSAQSNGVCRFSADAWAGSVQRNGLCVPFAAAPARLRCGKGLRCVKMVADEWRCLQPCERSGNNSCGPTLQCLFSRDLKATFCGEVDKGGACDLGQSKFCADGSRCALEVNTNQGRCQVLPAQEKGESCDPDWLPCKAGLRCTGLPLTPFRWTCTTPCDPKAGSGCAASEVCVASNQGGACQTKCSADSDCSRPYQRCLARGSSKVCL